MNYFLFTKQSVKIPLMQQRKVCESAHPMKTWSHAYCDYALDFTSSSQNSTLCTQRQIKRKETALSLRDHRVRQQLEGSRGDVLTALKSFQASSFTHGCDWTSDIKQLGEERLLVIHSLRVNSPKKGVAGSKTCFQLWWQGCNVGCCLIGRSEARENRMGSKVHLQQPSSSR